jgi:predicted polyphosphate/ATP-dependent NAD kinase
MTATVGIVANPASGRDIRRLVSGASVFDNAEKGSMVFRLMAGLGAAGIETVLMMPTAASVLAGLRRQLRSARIRVPRLEFVDMVADETAHDTETAVQIMCAQGARGIAVLGGDGTHRVVARHCGATPLCVLSTGTNNAFPEMREATVAGLALGLLASGRLDGADVLRPEHALRVTHGDREELALVDVAVSGERFVGARAVWRPDDVTELFVAFARPSAIGLSAVAGLLAPVARGEPVGLHIELAPVVDAPIVVEVPIAPGLIAPVGVRAYRPLPLDETVTLAPGQGSLALDGEREIERRRGEPVTVTLTHGPRTLDVEAAMRAAAASGVQRRG